MGKILVPVRGTRADDEAIKLACTLAKRTGGEVGVLYVIEVKRSLPLDAEIDEEIQKGEMALSQAAMLAAKEGYELETELLQAREAGPAIVDEAHERDAELIVMGLDYKKIFGEYSLGDTAPYVLRNAPCRVWLCREAMTVENHH
ncbi:MAG: universal stress protein [Chloroflexi bacterium]|nr:universal stress protein [Chloroflexota bacterium]